MTIKRMFLIPMMLFGLFMMGCTGNQSKVDTGHKHTEANIPHLETEGHKAGLIPSEVQVRLENGEKWVANVETSDGIDSMLATIKKEENKKNVQLCKFKRKFRQRV